MRSCIIGKLTADKYKLKVGDRVPFTSIIYPCTLEFKIVGIYAGTPDDRNMLFHHKYLEESCGSEGAVGTWWVKVRSIEAMPDVIAAINNAFANTSAEVRAESERAFQLSFISMWGNIKLLVGLICGVVMFSLFLVTASTMIMTIRERFRELAILKALGYRARELFGFILAESFGLAMSGALLALGSAWLLYMELHVMQKVSQGILLTFEVTPKIIGLVALAAATLGILASIVPAILAARMSVVTGMKTLD
jgi:putative ABC transport system permease protein